MIENSDLAEYAVPVLLTVNNSNQTQIKGRIDIPTKILPLHTFTHKNLRKTEKNNDHN